MRVVLHIGLEKTGTTSIQAHCHRHARELEAQGILYPAGLGHRDQADLATSVAPFDRIADMRARSGIRTEAERAAFRERVVARLRRQVARARPRCLLLSNEHFSSRCDAAAIGRLREVLASFSDDVRVLVYLRRQDQLLLSLYSTYIKAQGTGDMMHLADLAIWLDFEALLGRWSDAFGHDHLDVRTFPPRQGSLIEDFAAAAGLPDLPVDAEATRANRSLDNRSAALLARLNAFLPGFKDGAVNRDRNGLPEYMQARSSAGGLTMPRAEREAFLAGFAAGNEAVRLGHFPDRPTLFDPVTEDADRPADVTIDDAVELAAEFWARAAGLEAELDAARRGTVRSRLARTVRSLRDRYGR